eukprot:3930024-Karenia_brevis.AAC.1
MSACGDPSSGGVATLWREEAFNGANVHHQSLVHGRVLRTEFTWSTAPLQSEHSDAGRARRQAGVAVSLVVYNCHVWGLTRGQHTMVCARIDNDIQQAKSAPLDRIVLVMGDFNLLSKGELPHYVNHLDGAERFGRPFQPASTRLSANARLPQSGRVLDLSDDEAEVDDNLHGDDDAISDQSDGNDDHNHGPDDLFAQE